MNQVGFITVGLTTSESVWRKSMMLVRQLRVRQWIKNSLIFFPLIFSENLTDTSKIVQALGVAFLFSLLASAVYVINDIVDRKQDSNHPTKRYRPIAAGQVPFAAAICLVAVLLTVSLLGPVIWFSPLISLLFASYFVTNIAYSFGLKRLPPVDILIVALFFLARPLIGAVAIGVAPSEWMIITTFFCALYLVSLKRSAEIKAVPSGVITRHNLQAYSLSTLERVSQISLTLAIGSYAIYATGFPDYFTLTTIPLVGLAFRVIMIHDQSPERFESPRMLMIDPMSIVLAGTWFVAVIIYHWR